MFLSLLKIPKGGHVVQHMEYKRLHKIDHVQKTLELLDIHWGNGMSAMPWVRLDPNSCKQTAIPGDQSLQITHLAKLKPRPFFLCDLH